jgi:hypothetical protein
LDGLPKGSTLAADDAQRFLLPPQALREEWAESRIKPKAALAG